MNPIDEYLEQVRRHMIGMEPEVRDDILKELRSHVAEAAAADGGDIAQAIAGIGSAAQVGREYRRLYGYGRFFRIFFLVTAFLVAIPSSPVLQVTQEFPVPNVLAVPALILLVSWLLFVSVTAGSRTGLYAGATAVVARGIVASLLAFTPPYPMPTPDGIAIFVLTAALLILIGWLPGTAKKVWTKPGAEL